MKPAAFRYVRATSVDAAVDALANEDAKIIAGGQSLVPMMNFRLAQPELVVDINGIAVLRGIRETDTHIHYGALVRHVEALNCPKTAKSIPVVAEALQHVAHLAIRNRGTIGGSLVHADPSAEWPLLVTLLDGEIEIQGSSGKRRVSPEDFFVAPLVVNLEEDEVLVAVSLPKPAESTGMAFDEVAQRSGDFAIVSAGALLQIEDGAVTDARLVLGGVGDIPVRACAAEERLIGARLSDDPFAVAAGHAADGMEPNEDLHASADYRLHLVPIVAKRVLELAAERAARSEAGKGDG